MSRLGNNINSTDNNNNDDDDDKNNRKVRDLLLYRNNIKRDSTSSKILEMLYDDDDDKHHGISEFSLSDISKRVKKPYKFTKKIVLELKYSGYIDNHNNKSRTRGLYFLTQKGRWFALCQILDSIPFLSLCLLAETYYRVKSNPEFFYQLSVFRQFYEKNYANNNNNQNFFPSTAIYHRTNISKSLKHLTSRNLVYVVSGDFIKTTKHTIEFLKRYDKELDSLFLWCNDTYENCTNHLIDNNSLGFDISRIFPKGPN